MRNRPQPFTTASVQRKRKRERESEKRIVLQEVNKTIKNLNSRKNGKESGHGEARIVHGSLLINRQIRKAVGDP